MSNNGGNDELWKRLGVTEESQRRDALADPQRIKLNGQKVFSIEGLKNPAKLPAIGPDIEVVFDWERAARLARLTPAERALFMAFWRRETPRSHLPAELDLTVSQVNAAYARVMQKLTRSGATPILRSFTYAGLGQSYLEVMASEKLYLPLSQGDTRNFKKRVQFRYKVSRSYMELTQLHDRRKVESAKLERLSANAHDVNLARQAAERELEQLEASLNEEQQAALFAEKSWPTVGAEKLLTAARAKIASCASGLEAARAVVAKQSTIVAEIEEEIGARRIEALMAGLLPARAKAFDLMGQAADAAADVMDLAGSHGFNAMELGQMMFPPAFANGDWIEGRLRASLLSSLVALRAYLRARGRTF